MTLPAMTLSSAGKVASRAGRAPIRPPPRPLPAAALVLGGEGGPARRADDDPPAGQALADVVVGVAEQPHGDPAGHEGAEGLAGRPGEGEVDRAAGPGLAAAAPRGP